MRNPRLRIHPYRQHVQTSLLSDHSSKSYPPEETQRLTDQFRAGTSSPTARLAGIRLEPQHAWLPISEHARFRQSLRSRYRRFVDRIRTCHILILLGFLTFLGSLVPALWRSIAHNDIQGGFSLAQYILGVGVFIIGCIVAIHSRTCTCWQ